MLGLSNQEILYYYFDNTDDMTDEQLAEYTFSQQLMTMKYTDNNIIHVFSECLDHLTETKEIEFGHARSNGNNYYAWAKLDDGDNFVVINLFQFQKSTDEQNAIKEVRRIEELIEKSLEKKIKNIKIYDNFMYL